MKRLLPSALAFALIAGTPFLSPARAADMPASSVTELDFSVTGEARALPTLLTVRLSGQQDSSSAAEAQKALNTRMAKALQTASAQDGVEARAGGYSMTQITLDHGTSRWTARQEMQLSGTDSVRLLSLAGALQAQGLMLEGLDWSLDAHTREQLLQQARTTALRKVRPQATESAETLGLHVLRLKQVRVSSNEPGPRPLMMMARMADAGPAPQRTLEEQTIRVDVSVQAELAP
ncbi:SIMPL domain-containing protein [Gluconobacter morbifer]|uniref:Outer membrane protein n=1 Tax=Gluconobacter morbifer G707 TaxID=1088869 RepID=G6XJW9_9PROT|nr:SIMPL domain-containing protein [Gluconobacter morbifer]EHH67931.1 hypothetical protein GMO_16980 [Gluconobacter morbifer G707]